MENFILYMVKACGLIALFFLAYHTLLKKETFFNSNRWFLLAGLFTAVVLPLIVFTKTIWIGPAPIAQTQMRTIDLDKIMQFQQQLAAQPKAETISINWPDVMVGMYLAGVLLFAIRFVLDFLSIRKVLTCNIVIKDKNFRLIDSEKVASPFSFFNYIVYNSAILKPEELESIIAHEKVHSRQRHSLDMIFSQVFCIVFWFNPFIWMYKKSISQNLEFIADAEATRLLADKQAYQKTLLKITVQPDCIAITNHFYQSLIKKRIVMLNKQQSKRWNSWKYASMLPVLAGFMFLFQVKVVAQEKEDFKVTSQLSKIVMEVTKDSKDKELEEEKSIFKQEFNADVNFENIKRNAKEEITAIKVTVKDKGQSQVYEVAGNEPIRPFTIEVEQDGSGRNTIAFGTGGNDHFVKARAFHIADNENFNNEMSKDSSRVQRHQILRSYNGGDVPPPPAAMSGSWSVNSMKIGDSDMLIVVNGVKQKKGEAVVKLPLDQEIDQLVVLKEKEGKKKYGKEGKKGVVEITTKRVNSMAFNIGPEAYDFQMVPGMKFDMPMDFDIQIDDINSEEFLKMFQNPDIQYFLGVDGGKVFEENLKILEEQLKAAEEGGSSFFGLQGSQLSEDELKETKAEIEKARKEIEESRKELEKSRKDLEKARKELNKKA